MIQFRIAKDRNDAQPILQVHDTQHKTLTGTLAIQFAGQMVVAADMGTAMGGCQPHEGIQLMPVDKIVKRACDLAESLIAEMTRREFIIEGPTIEEILK